MSSNIRVNRICQFCSKEFEAKTTVTKYCGDPCAKKAYKSRKRSEKVDLSDKQTKEIITRPIEELKAKEFLSISETCQLVGVSRRTIYRCIERGDLTAGKLGRRTIIKRSEIDDLFEPPKEHYPEEKEKQDPLKFSESEFYSITEAQLKFGISEKALYEIIKREEIPKIRLSKYAYIPKSRIDKIFS